MADTNDDPGVVGWVSLFVVLVLFGFVFWAGYNFFSARWGTPPGTVSLSAYYAGDPATQDSSGKAATQYLKIVGQVYQGGKTVPSGIVQLSVTRDASEPSSAGYLRESASVDLNQGKFEIPDRDPRFGAFLPSDPLHIVAKVSAPSIPEAVKAELYLNVAPPRMVTWLKGLVVALLIAMIVFFYSFTGREKPIKNRTAICFSYIIILIFLAGPLAVPVLLLRKYPATYGEMIGKPAGLLITVVGDPAQACKDGKGPKQWALNIGGYSFVGDPCTGIPAPVKEKPAKTDQPNTAETPVPPVTPKGQETTAEKPKPAPVKSAPTKGKKADAAARTTPSARIAGTSDKPPDPVKLPDPADAVKKTAPATQTPATTAKSADLNQPVAIEGGLVIPFFVIVLSMIGGAINMARKVPRYKVRSDYSEISPGKIAQQTWSSAASVVGSAIGAVQTLVSSGVSPVITSVLPVAKPAGEAPEDQAKTVVDQHSGNGKKDGAAGEPAVPAEDQAAGLEGKIDALVKEQLIRRSAMNTCKEELNQLVQKMKDLFDANAGNPDNPPLLKFDTFEDWFAAHSRLRELLIDNWRVELLYQYMYLISAPFLAIIAYYILDLLGLGGKQPVVVVLSFSVGLVSEKIVSWILGIATGYLRTNVGAGGKAAAV